MKKLVFNLDSLLVRSDGLIETSFNDHLLMMSIEQGQYYDLNSTARLLWQALCQPRQVRQVCALLEEQYDVTESNCRASVLAFVQQLHSEGMIRVIEDAK
jgi:coenzyme PQQ synthesis protein D (PqqD)